MGENDLKFQLNKITSENALTMQLIAESLAPLVPMMSSLVVLTIDLCHRRPSGINLPHKI